MSDRSTLDSTLATEFGKSKLYPIVLAEAEFPSGDVRFWSGYKPFTWNSVVWTGAGDLLGIDEITETLGNSTEGLQVSLSGIPSALISTALSEAYQGKIARFYVGALDGVGGSVVGTPYLAYLGYMDVMSIEEDGDTATIIMTVENRDTAIERPNTQFYTGERQKLTYPADLGFDFVPELQLKEVIWK